VGEQPNKACVCTATVLDLLWLRSPVLNHTVALGTARASFLSVKSQVSHVLDPLDKGRILCPVDFDVNSLSALDLARDLARGSRAALYVLHVVPSPEAPERFSTTHQPPEAHDTSIASVVTSARLLVERRRQCHWAQLRFDELVRESLRNVPGRLLLRAGKPAEQILEVADELQPRLLVIATNSHTAESQPLLGSVAQLVIGSSPCPVLTVRNASKCEQGRLGAVIALADCGPLQAFGKST
jgi:nucleotide-binding universal stress UspA family protein